MVTAIKVSSDNSEQLTPSTLGDDICEGAGGGEQCEATSKSDLFGAETLEVDNFGAETLSVETHSRG